MLFRDATPDDWPAIWPILRQVAAAGDTFCWETDIGEDEAYRLWFKAPPGRTIVATDPDGTVLGTAYLVPTQRGPGAHIANASFAVDPAQAGRGIGRALGEHVIEQARADGFHAMQFNAVVATNTRAVALWQSLGFEVLATVPESFHHPTAGYVGMHIMHRRL